jgi:hypothetical protein
VPPLATSEWLVGQPRGSGGPKVTPRSGLGVAEVGARPPIPPLEVAYEPPPWARGDLNGNPSPPLVATPLQLIPSFFHFLFLILKKYYFFIFIFIFLIYLYFFFIKE